MTLFNEEQLTGILKPQDRLEMDESALVQEAGVQPEKPGILDTFTAALEEFHSIESFRVRGIVDKTKDDPEFDPLPLIENTRYEDFPKAFLYADNEAEIDAVKVSLDRTIKNREILDEAGWVGTLSAVAASILDPTMLLPGGAILKAARLGTRFLKGARSVGGAALAGEATQEALLQSTQEAREWEESALNIGAAAILGGLLGGTLGALSKSARLSQQEVIKQALKGDDEIKTVITRKGDVSLERTGDAGAARTKEDDNRLAYLNERFAKFISAPVRILKSATVAGFTSESAALREFTDNVFSHNFILRKHTRGIASGEKVTDLLDADYARVIEVRNQIDDLYLDYVGVIKGRSVEFDVAQSAIQSRKTGKLSRQEFLDEIGKALRRDDKHEIAQVQKAARTLRKPMDEVTQGLQRVGLLGEELEVRGAATYFSRLWDVVAIRRNPVEFMNRLTDDFITQAAGEGKTLSKGDAQELALDTYNTLTGLGDRTMANVSALDKNLLRTKSDTFLKERKIAIKDADYEDFLVNDGFKVVSHYLSRANSLVRLNETLQRLGYDDIAVLKKAVRDEYQEVIFRAKGPKKRKLEARQIEDENLVDDMIGLLTNQYKSRSTAFRLLTKYNAMRLLGGVLISSFPDVAMHPFVHGSYRTMRVLGKSMMNVGKDYKATKAEYRRAGIALEVEMNNVLDKMVSVEANAAPGTVGKVEEITDGISRLFSKATGLPYWNNMHKMFAARVSASHTLEILNKWKATGTMRKFEEIRLNKLGIGKDMWEDLIALSARYDETSEGVVIAKLENWAAGTNTVKPIRAAELKRRFGSHLKQEVDSTILTPGKGDVPIAVSKSDIGRVIFQFKTFIATANNRILLSGAQRIAAGDYNAAMGFLLLIHMGGLTGLMKMKLAGRDTDDMDYGDFLYEGLTRSGVTGLMMDVTLSANPFKHSSRYAGSSAQGALLGPSASLIKDAIDSSNPVLKALFTDKELSKKDMKRIIRFLPYSNLFYIKSTVLDPAFKE